MKTSMLEFQNAEQNFRRIVWICVLFYGAVAVIMNLITVRTSERQDYTQLSPRITKLIVEATKPLPPPPVVQQVKKEEPKAEEPKTEKPKTEKPKAEKQEAAKPEAAQKSAEAPSQQVAKTQEPNPEEIRAQQEVQRKKNMDVAMNSGLLKLLKRSDAKNGAGSVPDQKLKKVFSEIKGLNQAPQTTSGASPQNLPAASRGIDDIVAKLEKSIKESKSSGGDSGVAGSGGINQMIGNVQTDPGQSSLAEHKTTAVESPFQIKGFEEGKSPRSYESIAQVVDSYKGGVSFIYNKALRENPTLRGTVTVEFIIAASGEVIDCHVVSSSVKNPLFEEALVKRVLQWKFPPVPSGDVTVSYPIVFSISG